MSPENDFYLEGASEDLLTPGKTLQHSILEILEFCWEEKKSLSNTANILMKTKQKISKVKINRMRIRFCTLSSFVGASSEINSVTKDLRIRISDSTVFTGRSTLLLVSYFFYGGLVQHKRVGLLWIIHETPESFSLCLFLLHTTRAGTS